MSDVNIRTTIAEWIAERSTPTLGMTFRDEADDVVTPTACTLKVHTEDGVELKASTNILSSVTAGVLNYPLATTDTAILAASASQQVTIALVEWSWTRAGGGTGYGKHEAVFTVRNLQHVP